MKLSKQYLMGKLSEQKEKEMDKHLDQCTECTAQLDALLESEFQVTQQDQTQILRWLRTTFTLDPERERKGIKKIIADAQKKAVPKTAIGDKLKIVRRPLGKLASLVFGENWQPLLEFELGPEAEELAEVPPPSQPRVLQLISGSLSGTEVERTSADRLVISLNRPVSEGSKLKLITETGKELNLPVVHQLDRQGRAIYDLSGVSETPAFRLVLVEGEDSVKRET
jgi:hypothetical protein